MELTLLEKENRRNTLKAQLGLVKPFHQSLMRGKERIEYCITRILLSSGNGCSGAVPVLRSRYRSMLDDLQKALNEIDAEVAVLEKMNEVSADGHQDCSKVSRNSHFTTRSTIFLTGERACEMRSVFNF